MTIEPISKSEAIAITKLIEDCTSIELVFETKRAALGTDIRDLIVKAIKQHSESLAP
jgi:hypothetical protein